MKLRSIDLRDALGGLIIAGAGIFVVVHSATNYPFGTMERIGLGMFPAALGVVLTALGLVVAAPSLFRPGLPMIFDLRPFLAVIGSIFVFVALIERAGAIPALFLTAAVATLAERKLSPLGVLVLSAALCAMATLLFRVVLGIPMTLYRWPF